MVVRVDRVTASVSRDMPVRIGDTLSFVEDGNFLKEMRECELTDDDLEKIQTVITLYPKGGEIVPVTKHVRDLFYRIDDEGTVAIRYAFLETANTVLLLTAHWGDDVLPMTESEAAEAEEFISQQIDYFSSFYTR